MSQRLAKHSLPLGVLAFGLFAVSLMTGLALRSSDGYGSISVMQKALTSQFLSVTPAANGLAHIGKVDTAKTVSLTPIVQVNVGQVWVSQYQSDDSFASLGDNTIAQFGADVATTPAAQTSTEHATVRYRSVHW